MAESRMTYKGTVRGRRVELEGDVSLPEGLEVEVLVAEAARGAIRGRRGSPQAVLAALDRPARCTPADVEALLFGQVPCLPIPEEAADRYAEVKRDAERRGVALDENDLWIAATALSAGASVVTADQDFSSVRGLQVEDWTR